MLLRALQIVNESGLLLLLLLLLLSQREVDLSGFILVRQSGKSGR